MCGLIRNNRRIEYRLNLEVDSPLRVGHIRKHAVSFPASQLLPPDPRCPLAGGHLMSGWQVPAGSGDVLFEPALAQSAQLPSDTIDRGLGF